MQKTQIKNFIIKLKIKLTKNGFKILVSRRPTVGHIFEFSQNHVQKPISQFFASHCEQVTFMFITNEFVFP